MKLLFITSLIDFKTEVMKILQEAQVKVYSYMEATGVKTEHDENLMDDWFGTRDGEFRSLVVLSFTTEAAAGYAKQLIREYNAKNENRFPIRAFLMPVDED